MVGEEVLHVERVRGALHALLPLLPPHHRHHTLHGREGLPQDVSGIYRVSE